VKNVCYFEEHKLKASENKMLRKIFGSKKDKLTEQLIYFHNENSPPSSVGAKNTWMYTSNPPYFFMA
jgi:hypothetical protein